MSKNNMKFNISKEFLIEEYINKGKSTREIAKIIECAPTTIKNYLKKYNIKKESSTKNISKEILTKEYVNNKKSIRKVARIIGCNHKTIRVYLIKYNIKIRPNNRKKQTIESIKKQFAKNGYILTSTKYTDIKQKLEYICPIGHPGSITWGKWKEGNRCSQCYRESRRTKHKIINGIEGKHCSICKKWKPLNNFNKNITSWDGFAHECRKCIRPYMTSQKKYEQRDLWTKNNKDKVSASSNKRRAMKLNATPENANQKEIQFFYKIRSEINEILGGIYFHVDHFQPYAKGGLNHEDNLQILEAYLNLQKSAKWPLTPEEQIKYKGWKL